MGLLSARTREGRRWARGIGIGVLVLAGCAILDVFQEGEAPFSFPHRVHVEDEGLECLDCHMGADSEEEPGLPVEMQCLLCHEDIDSEKPPERRIDQFFVDGTYVGQGVSALDDEVVFSHLTHVQSGSQECSDCHGDVGLADSLEDARALSMEDCLDCHGSRVSDECATCHREIDEDWRPLNHDLSWDRFHGAAMRAGSEQLTERCTLCHSESSCTQCHAVEMPQSHNQYWRLRGHSVVARFERDRCAVCHQPAYCDRCHRETLPLNHTGAFGGTQNTHCLSCHFPLGGEGCITCHKDTQSHLLAAPKPPDHLPGMNCRQCHGVSVLLPHVDKGDDCNLCHL